MMKTKLYLVRHTETVGNIEKRLTGRMDYELTERGKASVSKLAASLSGIKFDKIYSSTSGRTMKTVLPIAVSQNIEIIQLDDLCEMYFGDYDGWKWDEVNEVNPAIKETQNRINHIEGIPNQESMEDVATRMYDVISRIMSQSVGENVLICSHGVAIEAFLRRITGVPFSDEREKYCQHNTAINELEFDNGDFKIIRMADINHLLEED